LAWFYALLLTATLQGVMWLGMLGYHPDLHAGVVLVLAALTLLVATLELILLIIFRPFFSLVRRLALALVLLLSAGDALYVMRLALSHLLMVTAGH
jgi:hypothetical protein